MATVSCNKDDATKIVFANGNALDYGNGSGGGTVKFVGTDLSVTVFVYSPNANPNNTSPVVTVSIDGGPPTNIPVTVLANYTAVQLATGLTDGKHTVTFSWAWSGICYEVALNAAGSNPGFWGINYLDPGGLAGPLVTAGNWAWEASGYNQLNGEIWGGLLGSGDIDLYVATFGSPSNALYVEVDGTEVAHTPAANAYLSIATDLGQATHSFVLRNETSGNAWAFYGAAGSAFLRVWTAPGSSGPSLAPYSGRRYLPKDTAHCDGPVAGFTPIAGLTIRDQSLQSVLTSPTWEALVLKDGAGQYLIHSGGADGAVQTLPGGGTYSWVTLASGLSGTNTVEFRTPVATPPQVFAFRTAAPSQATAGTPRPNIAVFGDSETQAINAGATYPDSTQGWFYQLLRILGAQGANSAVPGTRSDQILAAFQAYCTAYTAGQVSLPGAIAVYEGQNDDSQSVAVSTFQANVSAFIAQRNTTFPAVPMVYYTIARVASPDATPYNTGLSATIATAGGLGAGIRVIDIAPLATVTGNMYGDGVHFLPPGWLGVATESTSTYQTIFGTGVSPTISAIALASFLCSCPGAITGTITLSGAAGSGGQAVVLTTSDGTLTAPSTVTVPSGQTSSTFTLTAGATAPAANPVTVTGATGSTTRTVQVSAATALSSGGGSYPTTNAIATAVVAAMASQPVGSVASLTGLALDTGTVLSSPAPSTTIFAASGLPTSSAPGDYTGQSLIFQTGGRIGARRTIGLHAVVSGVHTFTLSTPLGAAPAAGDTFLLC